MKKIIRTFAEVVILVSILSACSLGDINSLPKGDLVKSVSSPNEKCCLNIYLVNGGATVDFAIRGEIENIETGEKRNIYWKYHCEEANIEWIDDETVIINGKRLNILTDKYDWRTD